MARQRAGTAFALGLALLAASAGAPVAAQTLGEAMAAAYAGNPNLEAARADLRATMENVPRAQSQLWRPQVTLSGSVTHTHLHIEDSDRASGRSLNTEEDESVLDQQYGYQVEVPLFDAQALGRIDQARANVRSGIAELESTEQTLLDAAVMAYGDVLLYRERVRLYLREVEEVGGELARAEEMLAANRRTLADIASIRQQLAGLRADLAEAYGDLAEADARYLAVTGSAPQTLELWPELANLPASLEGALMDAEALSPAIRQAKQEILAAEADVDAQVGAILPQLSFVHSYTHKRDDTRYAPGQGQSYEEVEREDEFTFELSLSVPIYQGGFAQASVRQAKRNLSKARLDLTAKQRDTVRQVTGSWSQLQAAHESRSLAETRLAAAIEAENGRAFQLERGQVTVDDLLTARRNRIDAELAVVQADHTILLRSADLLQAMGKLTAQAQNLAVETYDPMADLRRADGRWFGFGE
jgi:TolC family type I secretion outer membrane protein